MSAFERISKEDITAIASGRHHMDAFVRRYIHENLCYRFVMLPDCAAAHAVQRPGVARGFRMRLNRLPRVTTKNHAFQPGRQAPADPIGIPGTILMTSRLSIHRRSIDLLRCQLTRGRLLALNGH